jgi:glucose/arabinose dehydrogenase
MIHFVKFKKIIESERSVTMYFINYSLIILMLASLTGGQPCEWTIDQLEPYDFEASVVLNGETGRMENGVLVEPYRQIRKLTQLAFMPGNSRDVFFTQIYEGTITRWNTEDRVLTDMVNLEMTVTGERGMTGVAFHPDFEENKWVFIAYNPHNALYKLARFEYDEDSDRFINEKILLEHDIKSDTHHYGGGQLAFDGHGVLYVPFGSDAHFCCDELYTDNLARNAEATASNTNSIAGGILRIIPDSSEQGYHSPEGNFADHFAEYFDYVGEPDIAEEYRTMSRPEVFVKGTRTPFTVATHPEHGWLAWGEVNTGNWHDEYNIVNKPMFSGYPYFHGGDVIGGRNPNSGVDPANPFPNVSQYNTGASLLPPPSYPSISPIVQGRVTSATGGDIYDYENYESDVRFPKAFDKHFIMFDFEMTSPHFFVSRVDEEAGELVISDKEDITEIIGDFYMKYTLDAEFAPDGSLYLLNTGTNTYDPCESCGSIDRIIYTGEQCPIPVSAEAPVRTNIGITRQGNTLKFDSPERLILTFFNLKGEEVYSAFLDREGVFDLDMLAQHRMQTGMYLLSVQGESFSQSEKILLD